MIGKEGMAGVSLFMSGSSSINRIVVQSKGQGFRLRAEALQQEFQRAGPAMNVLLRFTLALMAQMAQTAVCNRHHSLDQQLCRWLLLSMDRLPSDQLIMTQELISNMLGVRRESVTEAANRLRRAGLIRYARGHIEVLDRVGLETRACECYAVVKEEYDRLLRRQAARPFENRDALAMLCNHLNCLSARSGRRAKMDDCLRRVLPCSNDKKSG